MKKTYIQLSCLLLLCLGKITQAQIAFEKYYVQPLQQSGKDVLETADGYIIAGTTETAIANDLDLQITKTDLSGNIVWQKTYGGAAPEYPNSILRTSDGNYFIVGYTQSFGSGDFNNYLVKINPSGDTLFTKVYGGYGNEEAKEIVASADGNYVMVGASNSVSLSDNDMQLIKIDPAGNVLWTKYYGDTKYQSARSVKLCPDGGFIIAGKTALSPTSAANILLIKTDMNGDTTWTKTISGPNSYEGKSILANSDGTYTLATDDSSAVFDSDIRIMKLTNAGETIWSKSYGGTLKDICKMIQPTDDSGYVVAGLSRSFWGSNNVDFWILKLNAAGDTTWTRHFGGSAHEHCYAVRQTSDKQYIAIGHTRSFSADWETYFVKFYPVNTIGVNEFASENKFVVYPNPSDGIVNITVDSEMHYTNFTIINTLGQKIYAADLSTMRGNNLMSIDLKENKPGIYFVTLSTTSQTFTKRLIIN